MINYTLFSFENEKGDTITATPIGSRVYQFEIKDKTSKERKAISNYSLNLPSSDIVNSSALLGADNNGLIYFR